MKRTVCGLAFLLYHVIVVAAPSVITPFHHFSANYKIEFDNTWKVHKEGTNKRILILTCDKHCDANSQLILSYTTDKTLTNLDNDYFMKNLSPTQVRTLITNMIQPIGHLKEIDFIKRNKIGTLDGYLVQLQLKTYKGSSRTLLYGLTFDKGFFYHLQFFASKKAFKEDQNHAYKVFNSFKIVKPL